MTDEPERIEGLEAEAAVPDERIAELEAEARARDDRIESLEADALVRDERIAELVAEVDRALAARDRAAVIEQAKGVIMSTTRCSPDAAFAVLVAASQRENVKLYDIAARIAAAQGNTA